MSGVFDQLVARYKVANISHPLLKPVTLAQWILESGRGTSELATKHLNFAGLKWRSEMVGFAVPVEYEAHDGTEFYCKFASVDAFIIGYWKFLSRSPYKGWEAQAAISPTAFINFIGPIYTPDSGYVTQVLDLVAEATTKLNSVPTPPANPPVVAGSPKIIVIDPGHGGTVMIGGSSPNNASSPSGEKEKNWTLDVGKRTQAAVLTKAAATGKNVNVFLTRSTDENKGLSVRANVAKSKGANLFLSIHFNASDNHNARGIETLISQSNVNKTEDRAFAQKIQSAVLGALNKIEPATKTMPNYDRGVKEQSLGVLNDVALGNTMTSHPCRACLVEVEFMDRQAVENLFTMNQPVGATNRQKIAEALADALLASL